jgi:2,4-diaminopentanoate dehydrogenase
MQSDNKYRIAHVGTGYTGTVALAQVLRSPRLRLVGQLVHSRDKVGRDSGELVGEPAVGVAASDSMEDFLALEADCVTYFAPVSGRDEDEVVGQLCAILASGKNVVTPSYFALFHPPSLDDTARQRLEAACRQGNSSLLATGIAPGFASDVLAVHAASLSALPTKVVVQERIPCGSYRVPGFFAMMGFGRTPAEDAAAYPPGAMTGHIGPALRLLAQGLGLTLDDIREHRDAALADRRYAFEAGEIPAGTIASVRMRFDGIVDGLPRVQFSAIWSMPDEPVEDWEPGIAAGSATRRLTRITVDGNPPVQVDFALNGGELPGADATAARVVNAIPGVCAAAPGILSGLDLVVPAEASAG